MEWEWISRGRECRQAIAWGGVLARRPGARCATKIVGDPDGRGWRAFHFVGDPSTAAPSAAAPRRYVFDVDPAAVAARLTTALAASHGLETLGPGAVYLTGDAAPDEPLLAAFGVEGVLPLRTSVVADYLRARRVGRVEIKKRGIEVDPEAFARGLRLDGDGSATLFLTRVGTARMTIVARRCVRSEGG